MSESSDLINEQAWLISRGVRPLALLESKSKSGTEMHNEFVRLNQMVVEPAIPFVLPRKDMDCAMVGFASNQWVIDLLEWSYDNAPPTSTSLHHRTVVGLFGQRDR